LAQQMVSTMWKGPSKWTLTEMKWTRRSYINKSPHPGPYNGREKCQL
jgi:hypothetical protein